MTWVMRNLASFCLETVLVSMVPLGFEAQVEARFGHWDILLILMQDMFTVCVKCTIGSEIILDTPDGTPR